MPPASARALGQQVPVNLDLEQAHWFELGPIGARL